MLGWLFRKKRKRRYSKHPKCDECKDHHAVVRCVCHNVALCMSCMFMHDDPGVCAYVPDSEKRKHWEKRKAAMSG